MAKPCTKLEKRVFELSQKLPALTEKHELYGNKHGFYNYYDTSYSSICCLECGHKWKADLDKARHDCPECGLKLREISDHKTWMRAQAYLMVIDRIEEFQVLRYLYINKWMRKGQSPRYDHQEVSQVFIRPDGKVTIMGGDRNPFGAHYSPGWKYDSDLSIKKHNNCFYQNKYTEHYSALYPNKKIIPELKRNGFKSSFYNMNPTEMMQGLLKSPMLETLLKRGNKKLFQKGVKYMSSIEDYWDELKITFRKNYVIEDYGIWTDYIDMLRDNNKDTRNPKYVCPDDLSAAHNYWMQKKQKELAIQRSMDKKEQIKRAKEKVGEWKIKYPEIRKAFLDFSIKHDHITIEVITSVEQLEEEATLLEHCAFVNAYYSKEESLLLSARVDGTVIETIEINLRRMEIVQNRGWDNKVTAYGPKIIKLVEKNLPKIRKLHKKQLKLSA